jgi:hypothetical protein
VAKTWNGVWNGGRRPDGKAKETGEEIIEKQRLRKQQNPLFASPDDRPARCVVTGAEIAGERLAAA